MSNAINVNTENAENKVAQFLAPEAHQRTVLHAQPYSLDAQGFCFTDMDDYQAKYDANRNCFGLLVEEYEIQFIDGETADAQLFDVASINQANLEQFFNEVESLDDYKKPALYFLLGQGYSLDEAISKLDDVVLYDGRQEDAAENLFDEIYLHEIPEHLHSYIDYQAFARDCEYSGDFAEFEFDGKTYTCTNASAV